MILCAKFPFHLLLCQGEGTVTTFEVSSDPPHLFALSPYKPSGGGLHQGLAFLPKKVVDVRAVEFARAFRLTDSAIEPVAFSVPRVRTALFQDDLFPPTRVLWEAAASAGEWFSGKDREARRVSMQPEDMQALSASAAGNARRGVSAAPTLAPVPAAPTPTPTPAPVPVAPPSSSLAREDAKRKEADIESAVSSAVGGVSSNLEQDDMEGVEEEEWVSIRILVGLLFFFPPPPEGERACCLFARYFNVCRPCEVVS